MSSKSVHFPGRALSVAVIGAGISGIGMAIKLKHAGIDFTLFEKAATVGGTWRDNRYPGLTCDVPAFVYTYSFARSPHWRTLLAPGAEIESYISGVFERFGLREHTRFGQEVVEAKWTDGCWELVTERGERLRYDVVIHATGFLHHPRVPSIPGLSKFAGPVFHSARWDGDVDLAGKRVGIVGTGSTGVQLVTALAGHVERVVLFQRTAQWILPIPNFAFPRWLGRGLERWPRAAESLIEGLERLADWFLGGASIRPGWRRRMVARVCQRALDTVRDAELKRRLTPLTEPLCKRPVVSARYYRTMQRPDVDLVAGRVNEIRPEGVVDERGDLHEVDVLVLATGFDAHAYMRPMKLVGEGGLTIDEAWRGGPKAYRTLAVPGFPNMFLMLGPHTPLLSVSMHSSVERQADLILQILARLGRGDVESVSPSPAAMSSWVGEIEAGMPGTVWADGCESWYVGPDGLPVLWPFDRRRWYALLKRPKWSDFVVRRREGPASE